MRLLFQVHLDGEKASQKELDTVAVLLAIQKSRETRDNTRPARKVGSLECGQVMTL